MKYITVYYFLFLLTATALRAAPEKKGIPLIDIKKIDPTIIVELRYANANNVAGRALYPPGTRALTRPELAQRLQAAQFVLRRYNYGLKIWDAYRPPAVQAQLWQASHNNEFVADPAVGAGSLHSWGLAVDATLVEGWDKPVSMPTDFDDFTPAAMWKYQGADPAIRFHLHLLQQVMGDAGFYGLRSEWWHFTIDTWKDYLPPEQVKRTEQSFGPNWHG